MSQDVYWKKRYQEWLEKEGLKDDASALEVFRSLMEERDRKNQSLVSDLKEHFDNIDVILRETYGERKNT